MAGGTWMSQNKVQPGVYINTKSSGNLSASIGEKGIVAIAEPLSWGPCEVMQTIIPGEDLTPYIGYDVTSEKAMFLREMMKGSDTTSGPIKILLYRPKGTDGAKATGTIGTFAFSAIFRLPPLNSAIASSDFALVPSGKMKMEIPWFNLSTPS